MFEGEGMDQVDRENGRMYGSFSRYGGPAPYLVIPSGCSAVCGACLDVWQVGCVG